MRRPTGLPFNSNEASKPLEPQFLVELSADDSQVSKSETVEDHDDEGIYAPVSEIRERRATHSVVKTAGASDEQGKSDILSQK